MKQFLVTLLLILLFLLSGALVNADKTAGTSAAIITYNSVRTFKDEKLFIKKLTIKKVLEKYHAPLSGSSDSFISACDQYKLDCYLLPSIAGLESTFGQNVYPNSYNPFGWERGYAMFNSWDKGINAVAKGLRDNYLSKGADSVEQIGRIYSESPTWAARVTHFMNEFQKEEEKLQLYLKENTVEL